MAGITREVSRRGFLGQALTGAATLSVAGPLTWRSSDAWAALSADSRSPIETLTSRLDPGEFTGDHFSRPHSILWQKPQYLAAKGGIPAPSETASVVIVG